MLVVHRSSTSGLTGELTPVLHRRIARAVPDRRSGPLDDAVPATEGGRRDGG